MPIMNNSASRYKQNRKISLRFVLILPFVLQIMLAVGLVGYFSYQSGQKTIEEMAKPLMNEVGERINQNLSQLLQKQKQVIQNNAAAIKLGLLPWKNLAAVQQYFWQEIQIYDELNTIGMVTETKEFLSIGHDHLIRDNAYFIRLMNKSTDYNFNTYLADNEGKQGELMSSISNFDPHNDPASNPWYKNTKQANTLIRQMVVSFAANRPDLVIMSMVPFYDKHTIFQGILHSIFSLNRIGNFLTSLKIGKTGQAFIIDRQGLLIATSTGETPFNPSLMATDNKQSLNRADPNKRRLNVVNSSHVVTQKTAIYLKNKFTDFKLINNLQELSIEIDNKPYFVQVIPLQNEKDLDWLTVIAIPQADFTAQIQANTQLTALLCLITLLVAIILGIATSNLITKPIRRLSQASKEISDGKLNQVVNIEGIKELKILADSFNSMAHDLQESFETLENRVQERTAELVIAKDKAEIANKAKTIFLANMNHELRTPLNGILGYAKILKRDKQIMQYKQAESGLNIIERSGDHLLSLITDILDLSKIEDQKMELYAQSFNLKEMLVSLCAIVEVRTKEKNLSLILDLPEDLPYFVLVDGKRLSQVLLNLLSNAVKFTDKNAITLQVQILNRNEQDCRCRFAVIDEGVGIAQSDLSAVFQAFKQVGEHNRQIEGTGLGLSISNKLVQLMGGELQVNSELNKGSIFWFELQLPITECLQSEHAAYDSDFIIGYQGQRQRILIIDDISDNREVLMSLLTPLDFQLMEATNGQEALSIIPLFKPDLILSDLRMPVMDGFEMIRIIRQDKILQHLKVVSISASSTLQSNKLLNEHGFNAVLDKPVQVDKLFKTLQEQLQLSWIYEAQLPVNVENNDSMEIPDTTELTLLYELTQDGDFVALNKRLEQLYQYPVFVKKIQTFAKTYSDKEIFQFIKRCQLE